MTGKFTAYQNESTQLNSPSAGGFAITPHDTNALATPTRSIYIGGNGNLKVTMIDGTTVTFIGVVVGTTLDIRCTHVFATLTTATNLIGLI